VRADISLPWWLTVAQDAMLPSAKEVLWLETAYVCVAALTPQEWLTTVVHDCVWFAFHNLCQVSRK
jgi:hypothetical protein